MSCVAEQRTRRLHLRQQFTSVFERLRQFVVCLYRNGRHITETHIWRPWNTTMRPITVWQITSCRTWNTSPRQLAACHVRWNTLAGTHSPDMNRYFNDLSPVVWSTTQRQAHAQPMNLELSSTTSPAAYRTTMAGTRLHGLVNNSCLSRHGDGRHQLLGL